MSKAKKSPENLQISYDFPFFLKTKQNKTLFYSIIIPVHPLLGLREAWGGDVCVVVVVAGVIVP